MNERNVEAIEALMREWWGKEADHWASLHNVGENSGVTPPPFRPDLSQLAAFLAAHGVLVPSGLDWEGALQAVQAAGLFNMADAGVEFTARLAGALERIAKGEG
jgi:hypothetical protein